MDDPKWDAALVRVDAFNRGDEPCSHPLKMADGPMGVLGMNMPSYFRCIICGACYGGDTGIAAPKDIWSKGRGSQIASTGKE